MLSMLKLYFDLESDAKLSYKILPKYGGPNDPSNLVVVCVRLAVNFCKYLKGKNDSIHIEAMLRVFRLLLSFFVGACKSRPADQWRTTE